MLEARLEVEHSFFETRLQLDRASLSPAFQAVPTGAVRTRPLLRNVRT